MYVLCTCVILFVVIGPQKRAQKRVIIAGNVIIIRYFVVSKDCSRLLILLRLERQYYNILVSYDLYDNKITISVPIAKNRPKTSSRSIFHRFLRSSFWIFVDAYCILLFFLLGITEVWYMVYTGWSYY